VSKGVLDRYVESLGCDFIPKEGKTWRLNTRSEDLGPLAGTISGDEVDLQVETQGRFRTGVVIRSKGLAVAAASFMRPGKIWIAKTLYGTEAQAAASVLGILMLYQETLTASVNCRISGDG